MKEYNRCLHCGNEIPNCCLFCLSCIEESELECKATKWIRSQGWDEETLPNDEYIQMKEAYIAGAKQYKEKYIDMNKAYQELITGWVIDYREVEQENEQLRQQIDKLKEEKQEETCPYRSTDMGCDYCDYRDRDLKDEVEE